MRPGLDTHSVARGPGHSVGLFAGVEVAGDFERFRVETDEERDALLARIQAGQLRQVP